MALRQYLIIKETDIFNDIISYCNLYESRSKNLWFAHVVQQTSPHDDIELAKIRSFVTANRTMHFSSNMLPRANKYSLLHTMSPRRLLSQTTPVG